ncbi:MAG: DUF2993 domain-containing protein [Chroococcales cyanobacterium]
MTPQSGTTILSQILQSAVEFWLRSQAEQVEDLQVRILSRDPQLLGGYIPSLFLSSHYAIYQGLHLSQIQLKGDNLHIDLVSIIQGQPLRLLKPIVVTGEVLLKEAHLQASLSSPLLLTALSDLLLTLLDTCDDETLTCPLKSLPLNFKNVKIDRNKLSLGGHFTDTSQQFIPFYLETELTLVSPSQLRLSCITLKTPSDLLTIRIEAFEIDLGPQVNLEQLTLIPGEVQCKGGITVIPK